MRYVWGKLETNPRKSTHQIFSEICHTSAWRSQKKRFKMLQNTHMSKIATSKFCRFSTFLFHFLCLAASMLWAVRLQFPAFRLQQNFSYSFSFVSGQSRIYLLWCPQGIDVFVAMMQEKSPVVCVSLAGSSLKFCQGYLRKSAI